MKCVLCDERDILVGVVCGSCYIGKIAPLKKTVITKPLAYVEPREW